MFGAQLPQSDTIKIYNDGTCVWWPTFDQWESHCPIDVTWFPFDKQTCELAYELYQYANSDVNMTTADHDAVVLEKYQKSDEWQLLGMSTRQYIFFGGGGLDN